MESCRPPELPYEQWAQKEGLWRAGKEKGLKLGFDKFTIWFQFGALFWRLSKWFFEDEWFHLKTNLGIYLFIYNHWELVQLFRMFFSFNSTLRLLTCKAYCWIYFFLSKISRRQNEYHQFMLVKKSWRKTLLLYQQKKTNSVEFSGTELSKNIIFLSPHPPGVLLRYLSIFSKLLGKTNKRKQTVL